MKTSFPFAAGIALALAFIFSCSDEKGDGCYMQENEDDTYTMICGDEHTIFYINNGESAGSGTQLRPSSSSEEPSSSSEAPSSSSAEQFAWCVYSEWRHCAPGPVTSCPGNGELSNECPDFTLPEYAFCVYSDFEACLPGPHTECRAGGELSNECPFTKDIEGANVPCTADYNDFDTFRTRDYYCSKDVLKKYGSVKDSRDNKTYKTIVIGEQTWMAENLNYKAESSLCVGDLETNCDIYGRLYDWAKALALPMFCDTLNCGNMMVHKEHPVPLKGLCPEGWHIPSKSDLIELIRKVQSDNGLNYSNLLGATITGRELRARSGWKVSNVSYAGEDAYGFTALAGSGYELFYPDNVYYGHPDYKVALGYGNRGSPGTSGYFWSYNDTHTGYIVSLQMLPSTAAATFNESVNSNTNEFFYSVRCLKD